MTIPVVWQSVVFLCILVKGIPWIALKIPLNILKQARTGHRLVCAWFLRIASVYECLYVYTYVCLFVCESVCVCVRPKAINN